MDSLFTLVTFGGFGLHGQVAFVWDEFVSSLGITSPPIPTTASFIHSWQNLLFLHELVFLPRDGGRAEACHSSELTGPEGHHCFPKGWTDYSVV